MFCENELKRLFMKNVFRVLAIISIALVIGFSFAACDDGSTGGGGGGSGGLIGKWYTHQEHADARREIAVVYEFKSNGVLLTANIDVGATYKASGGKLQMWVSGYTTGETADYRISGTELTIYNAGSNSGWANGTLYKPR
jgi:uncharacterized lipoprotein YehR (DUF1307 family)